MTRHPANLRPAKGLSARLARPLCLAALALGACSSPTWRPAPASVIPVHTGGDLERPPGLTKPGPTTPRPDPTASRRVAPMNVEAVDFPAQLEAPLAVHVTCDQKECALPGLYPPIPAIDGKAPAVIWSHDITSPGGALQGQAGDASVVFPRHAGVDLYGVVLRGNVQVKDAPTGEGAISLAPWSAFRAPGAGVRVTADASARVAFALVSGGEPIAEVVVKLRGKDKAKLDWVKRPGPLETVDLATKADLTWAGGAMRARIGFEGEKQRASLGVLIASKDTPVAEHRHETSWEVLAVLRGAGSALRANEPGASELALVPVSSGTVVMMPKGVLHAWSPDGTQPLIALQLYVPPGPEQRFRKLAADAAQQQPPKQ
jgi:mannose-6-phosphate isomerase-like protein (cupin superfamily)